MPTICPCTSHHHGLTHWKCVFICCEKCPGIITTHQETNKDTTNTCSIITLNVYCHVLLCNIYIIRPYEEQKICSMCFTDPNYVTPGKYTHEKSLSYLEIQYQNYTTNNIFQKFKNQHFIFHMCIFLEHITVAKNSARNLNARAKNRMLYAGVIMKSGQYQVLHTKYNMNNMVAIGLYPLKELHQSISVIQTRQVNN